MGNDLGRIFGLGLTFIVLVLSLAGLLWLLFKRCKISVPQLLAAAFFYGLMAALLNEWLAVLGEPKRFLPLAGCLILAVALGIFFGARTAARVPEKDRFFRWAVYLSALAMPATIAPGLITTAMMFSGHSPIRLHPIGVFIWLLLILPTVTGIATQYVATQEN